MEDFTLMKIALGKNFGFWRENEFHKFIYVNDISVTAVSVFSLLQQQEFYTILYTFVYNILHIFLKKKKSLNFTSCYDPNLQYKKNGIIANIFFKISMIFAVNVLINNCLHNSVYGGFFSFMMFLL